MLGVTRRLLLGSDWRKLSDYASPALFDVVSPQALASIAGDFVRAQLDVAGERRALEDRGRALQMHGLPVFLAAAVDGRLPTPFADRRTRGDVLLRLYFHQLLVGPVALLDLGPHRFSGVSPLAWSPSWARHTWSGSFRSAVHNLYAGFYGDDRARFDAALAALGLTPARAAFLDHFGGDPTSVRFSALHFRGTFHGAFVACRDAGTQIHPDFLPMGMMLSSLYAHLEALDVPLDVQAAWRDVEASAESDA